MSRTPRVLFVIPGEGQGHSMVFARRQADALTAQGIAVEPFYLRSRTSPLLIWSEARRFRKTLARFAPDLVHAHFGTVTGSFAVLASYPVPVVITFRGSDLNHVPTASGPRAVTGRLLSQLSVLGASGLICVSPRLLDQLWWRRAIARVIPSGVDTDTFRPQARTEARDRLRWRHTSPVVLFNLGQGGANKRLDLAQAAFDRVQAALPAAHFAILDGSVPPAEIPLWMNAADCLLVTSDSEGSPTVVQEALATNLPIVSVDTGDVVCRLEGVAATHIVARYPEALAQAVTEVLRAGKRSDGRAHVSSVSLGQVTAQLIELYRSVTDRVAPETLTWNTTCSSPR